MSETVLFGLVSGSVGGGQRVALSVAKALVKEGHEVAAVAPDDGVAAREFQSLGGEWQAVGSLRSYSAWKAVVLSRLFRSWRVTCVYTHTVPVHEVVLAAAARLAGVRLVVHRHSLGLFSARRYRAAYQRHLWKHALRGASQIVCVAEHIRKQVAMVSGRHGLLVPNGVLIPQEALATCPGRVVGFVGRLDPNKRLEDFLEAAQIVRQSCPDVQFVVVGSGRPDSDYEAHCHSLSRELGLGPAVTFVGTVDDPDAAMRSIDILVLPSTLEGHPISLLEAMARAKAVVATDIPGCRETISDGVTGRLVSPRDPKAIAAAVLDLLASADLRERLGAAARELVCRQYSEDRMLHRLLPLVIGSEQNRFPSLSPT